MICLLTYVVVTGKRAQYVRQDSWDMFGAGIDLIENKRRLFGSGQITDGKYFETAYTPTDIPAELKTKAIQEKGTDRMMRLCSLSSGGLRRNCKAPEMLG